MNNFYYYNPTKIFFGKNAIKNLSSQITNEYKNILLVYGKGSIKKIKLYDQIIEILKNNYKNIFELDGVTPNPRLDKVYEGIKICKDNKIDFILAVGGGSVIDCAKAISLGAKEDVDIWNKYYRKKKNCGETLPLGTILTISATGSEMNNDSVITDWNTHEKLNYSNDKLYPKFSILDPTYTCNVKESQTIYGSIDIIIHVLEQYFSYPDELNLSDYLSEGILKFVIKNIKEIVKNPKEYKTRSNLMWSSSMALNSIIGLGKEQDWSSHNIGHALSALYDIPHGATLSIIFPSWMKYVYKKSVNRFARYAVEVLGIKEEGKTPDELALLGIDKTRDFFKELGAPTSLKEVNVYKQDLDKIIDLIDIDNAGSYIKITKEDIRNILNDCL